jgi:hypothetical protein
LTEMDFLTVSVKMAQTFEATTIRGKRGTFITKGLARANVLAYYENS